MTKAELDLLADLCACEPDKGLMIPHGSPLRRAADQLLKKNYVMCLEAIIRVYIATEEGRAAHAAMTSAKTHSASDPV